VSTHKIIFDKSFSVFKYYKDATNIKHFLKQVLKWYCVIHCLELAKLC